MGKLIPEISTPRSAGYDCGYNGSNQVNSHFHWFSTPVRTKEWEAGLKRGKLDKKVFDKLIKKNVG